MSDIDKDWCLNMAALEGDAEIGAGGMTDDDDKALEDAVLYGAGFMKDGKHIPIEDLYLDPRDATIEAQAAEIEKLREQVDDLMRELAYHGRYSK